MSKKKRKTISIHPQYLKKKRIIKTQYKGLSVYLNLEIKSNFPDESATCITRDPEESMASHDCRHPIFFMIGPCLMPHILAYSVNAL